MHPTASSPVMAGMALVAFVVGAGFVALQAIAARRLGEDPAAVGTRTAGLVTAWMAATFAVGWSGILLDFDVRPPPAGLLFLATGAVGVAVGASRLGGRLERGLPLWALVATQAFRLPLELVMHAAADEGTMPVVMSFEGYNYDIVTGITAILAAAALYMGAPRWLAAVWNILGFVLLLGIVTIAFLASPLVRLWGDAQLNVWVAYAPFTWLPTVMVAAAIAGHIVVARALRSGSPAR